MSRTVTINTPGRLHFGLNSLSGQGRQFAGLGVMIEQAGVTLRISSASAFQTTGPFRERAAKFATAFASHYQLDTLPACKVEVNSHSQEHTGLGIGTQLGLAVVAGLSEWLGKPWRDAELLSSISGRGLRSAIGTHGFLQGGLLVDAGKQAGETIGHLANRVELPSPWRFLLVRQEESHGLHGNAEKAAIDSLPSIPEEVTTQLKQLINDQILPSARNSDWQLFSESIYAYGHLAGECFSLAQGGPFASPGIAKLVDSIRQLGIPGVGQSSWGPTVYAITQSQQQAEELEQRLRQNSEYVDCHILISKANNVGAVVMQEDQ